VRVSNKQTNAARSLFNFKSLWTRRSTGAALASNGIVQKTFMDLSRRKFLDCTAVGLMGGAAFSVMREGRAAEQSRSEAAPLVVSTWPFGKSANEAALAILAKGGSNLDAVEQGIWVVESDPSNHSVGLGGRPNAAGVVQLDACIMSGPGHRGGSVAAIEGIRHPISAARRVMEKTPHVMLVGEGARLFALQEGLESTGEQSREKLEQWHQEQLKKGKPAPERKKDNHDTIALLVLGADGNIAGGCSTSGLAGKLPGRVGDSPILGSGLYVDNEIGAAGATGVGENVMRYCGSFLVVEFMRQGLHPTAACEQAIRRIAHQDPKGLDISINFVALDKKGRFGAAGTDKNFQFSVASSRQSVVLPPTLVDSLERKR
jgi:N4-(beta-N-acetylglucosaminyl)-L-asparaginase